MVTSLRVTSDMLQYRENLLRMDDIDWLVMDLKCAMDELAFAFNGGNEIGFDLKYINNIINFAKGRNIGLGEGFTTVAQELKFPFVEKSLLSRKVVINHLDGGLHMISKLDNFDMNRLLSVLHEDQERVKKIDECYDLREYI